MVDPDYKYGSQGDEVKVYSMYGLVWIVEGAKEKFPVHRDNITIEEVEIIAGPGVETAPSPLKRRKIVKGKKVTKSNNQSSIF